MCICTRCSNTVTSTLVGQAIGFANNKSGYLLRDKPQHSEVVEAVKPIKWAPASLFEIMCVVSQHFYVVNVHMQCPSPFPLLSLSKP